jgi:hypothetical protein
MGIAGSKSRILAVMSIFLGGKGSLPGSGFVCGCLSVGGGTHVLGSGRFGGFGQWVFRFGGWGTGGRRVLGFPGGVSPFLCGSGMGFGSDLFGNGLKSVIGQKVLFSSPFPKHSSQRDHVSSSGTNPGCQPLHSSPSNHHYSPCKTPHGLPPSQVSHSDTSTLGKFSLHTTNAPEVSLSKLYRTPTDPQWSTYRYKRYHRH